MNNLTTLNNGITVITHHNPDLLTASIGVWLSNGTRYETDNEHGYAHFLEHLVFKQTRFHTGHQLSSRFEVMGGHINAETGREITAFHGLVPHHHTINLLLLLIEMLFDSDFNQDDFETERDVVLQELAMLGDDPEEALEDFGTEQVWFNDNIGRQILGSEQSLQGASSRIMHDYLLQVSGNSQLCVVATGNINHEEICNVCDDISKPVTPPSSDCPAPEYIQTTKHLDISTEQKHLLWIMPAVAYNDRLQPAFEIANHILVGGYDSRLYQVLREQMGLVYSIDSRVDNYSDTGLWFIQTNTDKKNSDETSRVIEDTILKLINNGVTDQELANARQHLQSSMIIAQDDLESHMDKIARDFIYTGNNSGIDEQVALLQQVTHDDISRILKQAWSQVSRFTAG